MQCRIAANLQRGFTLVELLVVIAVIGLLVGLLLPAVQSAREASRRSACSNNLKQIGVALLSSAEVRRLLPVGARSNVTFGMSWWVDILPYLEESSLFERLDRRGPHCGATMLNPQNAQAVDNVLVEFMTCPSSPFDRLRAIGGIQIMMPSYVGVAGASSADGFAEDRVAKCCLPKNDGEISAGGVLVPNRAISLREVSDGLSNTIAVGECSNFAIHSDGNRYRIDGGFPNGWITGTRATGTPPDYDASFPPPSWNITTVRYRPNMFDYTQPGIDQNRGANNPLVSAHNGGVTVLILDGSVRFVVNNVAVHMLKELATRDDGRSADITDF